MDDHVFMRFVRSAFFPYVFALVPFIAALITYASHVSSMPTSGAEASALTVQLGLAPFNNFSMPIWHSIVNMFSQGENMFKHMNLFGMFINAAIVYLVAFMLYHYILLASENDEAWTYVSAMVASLCAGIACIFATSQLITGVSLHSISYHALLAWGSITGLLMLFNRFSSIRLYVLVLVYAIALTEDPLLYLTFPLFGIGVLVLLARHDSLKTSVILICGLIMLSVLASSYLYQATVIQQTDMFINSNRKGLWQALGTTFLIMRIELIRSIFFSGWLLVFIVVVVPFLFCIFIGRRALRDDTNKTDLILHLILTIVLAMVQVMPEFSPWRLFSKGQVLVIPAVMMALMYGYLVGYWLLTRLHPGSLLKGTRLINAFIAVFLVVVLVYGSVNRIRSFKIFSGNKIKGF